MCSRARALSVNAMVVLNVYLEAKTCVGEKVDIKVEITLMVEVVVVVVVVVG